MDNVDRLRMSVSLRVRMIQSNCLSPRLSQYGVAKTAHGRRLSPRRLLPKTPSTPSVSSRTRRCTRQPDGAPPRMR